MTFVPSATSLVLTNAQKVYTSLCSSRPLYLGQGFSIQGESRKRTGFSELISCLHPNNPHYQQILSTLRLIAIQQAPSELSYIDRILNAISPVLPKNTEVQRLQQELSAMISDLDENLTVFNARCLHKMKDYILSEATHLTISRKFGVCSERVAITSPSANSTESLALFLRWMPATNQDSRVRTLAIPTPQDILDIARIRDSSLDHETMNMANYIIFMIRLFDITQVSSKVLSKIPHEYYQDETTFHPNDQMITALCKWLSNEKMHTDYEDKYKQLTALSQNSIAHALPKNLYAFFNNLSFEAAVKSTDGKFHKFLEEKCGIDCSLYNDPTRGIPIPLSSYPPAVFSLPSSASSKSPVWMLTYAPIILTPSKSAAPAKPVSKQVVDSSIVDGIFKQRTVTGPLHYHERVSQWFDDLATSLSTDQYRNLGAKVKTKIAWVHSFPKLVDSFVGTEYCLEGQWKNKYLMFFIPAEIEQNGEKTRGGFQYSFLPNGTCYHRAWGEKSNNALIDQLMNQTIWNQVDFPPFEETENKSPPPKQLIQKLESFDIDFDSQSGLVSFMDGDIKITLFRIGH